MPNKQPQSNVTLTKKQYQVLMNALQVAGSVYGIMGDMVDEDYKKQSGELDDLESHFLEYADELGLEDMVDIFDGRKVVDEEYLNWAIEDLGEFEEYAFWDNLPRKLARRDAVRQFGEKAVLMMSPTELLDIEFPIEEQYREEFDEYGLDRVRIDEENYEK